MTFYIEGQHDTCYLSSEHMTQSLVNYGDTTGWAKKVSLLIIAITLSTGSQFS